MPETTITYESLIIRNAKLKREFAQLKDSYKKGQLVTAEQKAETDRLMAEAKQLNADVDSYIEQSNSKL